MIENSKEKIDTMENTIKEKKVLSFSISSILGEGKKSETSNRTSPPEDSTCATVHHYGVDAEYHHYTHFDTHVQPRACSTPENDAYPSPTPAAHPRIPVSHYPVPHGALVLPGSLHVNTMTSPDYFSAAHISSRLPVFSTHSPSTNMVPAHPAISSDRLTPEVQDTPLKATYNFPERSNDKSLDSMGESYHCSPSPMKCKKKKSRTVFSRNQVYQLESAFDMKRYLSSAERTALAARLSLSETQIKIWFQNRRNKWKRQINGEMDEIPVPPAFAANFLPYAQSAYTSGGYGHVLESREDMLRGALATPSYYSHPYMHDSRKMFLR